MKLSITIKLSDDLELEIEGFYTPEEPMVWTLPNGDPGYPGSASEFDINKMKIVKGDLVQLIDILSNHQWQEMQKIREHPNKFIVTSDLWTYLTELSIKQIENE